MKLYVYKHCPFCIRVLAFINLKGMDVEVITLLNDDEETPISMTGIKSLPILEKNDGEFMGESLDIIEYLDNLENPILSSYKPNKFNAWLESSKSVIYSLAMPRWADMDLPEFKTASARDYFIVKKESYVGDFAELKLDTLNIVNEFDKSLLDLELLLKTQNDKVSIDDIVLFSSLHGVTSVSEIKYPIVLKKYLDEMSEKTKIKLYSV